MRDCSGGPVDGGVGTDVLLHQRVVEITFREKTIQRDHKKRWIRDGISATADPTPQRGVRAQNTLSVRSSTIVTPGLKRPTVRHSPANAFKIWSLKQLFINKLLICNICKLFLINYFSLIQNRIFGKHFICI